ncbi:MAG: serine/threonine protein kinase [Planctomycetes bacterium]|nr:serine/threonine protein kinase [Planctomycetota bacterium]
MEYDRDAWFCQAALRGRAVDLDAIHDAAQEQRRQRHQGETPEAIQDLLVRRGVLSREQVEALLARFRRGDPPRIRGRVIGGYRVLRRVGRGGMGSVYEAQELESGERVAMKIIARKVCDDPVFTERFLREARIALTLFHENIVAGREIGVESGRYYFVMEFVDGRSLGEVLRGGNLPEARSVGIALQVALALEYASGRKLVHRDIKPDNILVGGADRVKLCDLGLARPIGGEGGITTSGVTVGTPKYMSPEQVRGERSIDVRSDIYSLGITLWHMLVGEPPFNDESPLVVAAQHLNDEVPPPRTRNPAISPSLDHLVTRMTRIERPARYQTPAELIRDLRVLHRLLARG